MNTPILLLTFNRPEETKARPKATDRDDRFLEQWWSNVRKYDSLGIESLLNFIKDICLQ